ncbi:MAG: fibronectin type III domain-containing protein, partial [Bacteroidales bacterium]|nr:fibronectin type III domain-containing protein [Bacteroidales bacterium]
MKKHLQILSLVAALCLPWMGYAQTLDEYGFSTGTDTSKWIPVPTSITSMISAGAGDYGVSTVHNLGFSFPFAEGSYTQFSVNADGNLCLGSTVTGTSYYSTPFSSSNANYNSPKINMMGCDGYVSSNHYVRYLHTADANGDSVGVVEFCVGTYNSSTRSNEYKWQVHLYHNGTVEVVFGAAPAAGPAVTQQRGLCTSASDGWFINGSHTATHFTNGTSTTIPSGTWPTEGRYYTFSVPNYACPKPYIASVQNLEADAFDVVWSDTSDATAWLVRLDSGDVEGIYMEYYDTMVSFTDLYPNSSYTVNIAGLCSNGDTSLWRSVYVRTPCVEVATEDLPYIYGFDDVSTGTTAPIDPCWHKGTNYSSTAYPYPSSSYSMSGSNSLYFYSYRGGSYRSWASLPLFSDSVNTLQVEFDMMRSSTSYEGWMTVGVMTDPTNPATFTAIEMVQPQPGTTNWEHFEIPLSRYTGYGRYITLMCDVPPVGAYDYNYVYVDNVSVNLIPACPKITNLAVDSAGLDFIALSWRENGDASAWVVEYADHDFVPGTGVGMLESAYDTNIVIMNLDSATTYHFYVHADCGGDTSENRHIEASTLMTSPIAIPYSTGFEAEDDLNWTLLNGNETNKWYIGAAAHSTGSAGLYISSNNGSSRSYNDGATSTVWAYRDIQIPDSGEYAYSYDWINYGESEYYDFLRVFLVPSSASMAAGVPLGGSCYNMASYPAPAGWYDLSGVSSAPYTLAVSNSWNTVAGAVRINTPGTYRIVFAWTNDGGGSNGLPAAVDNVSFTRNTCPQVQNLHVEYAGQDSIIIAWQPGGDETEWIVSLGSEEYVTVDTFYVFENLQSASAYTFVVRAICGADDTSMVTPITARTQCGAFGPLPLSEDFSSYDYNDYPDCWYRVTNTYSYPYVDDGYGLALMSGGGAYIVTPRIPAPVNGLVVSFDLQQEGTSSGSMEFGYTTSATDIADSMVVLRSITPPSTYVFTHYEIDLSTDTSLTNNFDSVYLVWHQNGSDNWYYWLDNIYVEPANDCAKPVDLVCTANSNPDSVAIQWNEAGSATSWQVFIGAAGATPNEDDVLDVYDTYHVFSGLVMGNSYDVYVRSDCGDGFSNWCGPLTIIPGSVNLPAAGVRTITGCGITVYDNGGATGNYSDNVDGTLIIYPSTDSLIGVYGTFNGESCCDYLYIYDGAGASGTQLHYGLGYGATSTIDTLYSTTGPLTIRLTSDGSGNYPGLELHTFCVPAPDCGHVEDLSVTPGITTAMVSWTPSILGNYSGAEVEFREAGDTSISWTTVNTSETYTPITGLTANTLYDLRVSANCDGAMAEWTNAQFMTRDFECAVVDSTLMHNDTITGSSTTSYNIPVNNYYHNTFSEQLYTADELDTAGTITGFSLNLAYTSAMTAKTNCTVYLANTTRTSVSTTDYIDPADMTKVYTGSLNCSSGWNHFDFNEGAFAYSGGNLMVAVIDNSDGYNSSSYTWACHNASNRAMSWYSDSYFYPNNSMTKTTHSFVPDIVFNFAECTQQRLCAVPVASVANVTSSSADLVWAPGNVETSWSVYARPAGAVNYTYYGTVTTTNYSFTGLMPGTNYDFMVTALCGDDSNSAVLSATTQCALITSLPYTENFNSWGTGSIPNCWYKTGSYSTYGNISSTYNHSGSTGGSIYTYASSGTTYTTYTIMPEIDTALFQANQLQLVFNAYNSSTSYAVDYAIGVMTDAYDINTFVPVDTIHVNMVGQWEEFEVPLSNYTGNGGFVAVKSAYITAYGYGYLDDFTLEMIPTCPRPDSLYAVNGTTSTVDLGWHERGSATDWIIEYGPVGFTLGTGTIVNATSNPFTLTGLPSSFDGEFYVRSVCSTTDTGLYSRTSCRFSTSQMAASLPYSCDFEGAEASAWQTNSNSPINWFVGTADAASPTHSMYVSANNGVTVGNENFSSLVNASAFRDIDFGTVDSSFTFTFKAKAGGSTDAAYDGLMVFLVDPSMSVVAPTTAITSPWGNVNNLYRIATVRLDTTWREYSASFDTIHGIQRVAFFWFNQNTASSHPYIGGPAAVDDIYIDYSSCPRPLNMRTVAVGSTSATLTWDGAPSAEYRVVYREAGAPVSTNTWLTTYTNSITITGLTSMHTYHAWVEKICSATDSSLFSDGVEFQAEMCDNATVAYSYDDSWSTTTSSYAPMGYSYYNYGYVQTIIDSAQLASLNGDITAFAFNPVNGTQGNYYTNMDMYLANISESSFSGASFIYPDANHNFVQVLSGADLTYTDGGWQTFSLDTTFTWDGHSNLLVSVNRRHGSYSSGASFNAHNTSDTKTVYAYTDGGAYDINSASGGYALSYVGDLKFVACGSTNCATPTITGTAHTYESATV